MLSQSEIDYLLQILKEITGRKDFTFPGPSEHKTIDLVSQDKKEKFIVDINRKGKIKLTKCTFQNRYQVGTILLRLEIDGRPHTNPDGKVIPCPHIHIAKENYGIAWAYPLPQELFTNVEDLVLTLIQFLEYCKVTNVGDISIQDRLML